MPASNRTTLNLVATTCVYVAIPAIRQPINCLNGLPNNMAGIAMYTQVVATRFEVVQLDAGIIKREKCAHLEGGGGGGGVGHAGGIPPQESFRPPEIVSDAILG